MLYGYVKGTLNFLSLGIGQKVTALERPAHHSAFEDQAKGKGRSAHLQLFGRFMAFATASLQKDNSKA